MNKQTVTFNHNATIINYNNIITTIAIIKTHVLSRPIHDWTFSYVDCMATGGKYSPPHLIHIDRFLSALLPGRNDNWQKVDPASRVGGVLPWKVGNSSRYRISMSTLPASAAAAIVSNALSLCSLGPCNGHSFCGDEHYSVFPYTMTTTRLTVSGQWQIKYLRLKCRFQKSSPNTGVRNGRHYF